MRPVTVKDETGGWAKPVNWDESALGPCNTLSVRREVIGECAKAYVSHFSNWKPSAEELAMLNDGGVVELQCVSLQPAVAVGVVPCADPAEPASVPAPLSAAFWKRVADRLASLYSVERETYDAIISQVRES